jgi:hypothetical protein
MESTRLRRVGKGGHDTLIDALRRVRRAHAEHLNLPKRTRGHGAKSAFAHPTRLR